MNKSFNIIIMLLISAMLWTAPAQAANQGAYAGVQVGNGFTVLGGVQLDKILSAEVDYSSYNSGYGYSNCGFANCGNYVTASALGFYVAGIVPLQLQGVNNLSAYGKVGIVRTAVTAYNGGNSYSVSTIGLGLDGGLQYDFNKTLGSRLGLTINNNFTDDIYIGVIARF